MEITTEVMCCSCCWQNRFQSWTFRCLISLFEIIDDPPVAINDPPIAVDDLPIAIDEAHHYERWWFWCESHNSLLFITDYFVKKFNIIFSLDRMTFTISTDRLFLIRLVMTLLKINTDRWIEICKIITIQNVPGQK